MVLLLRLALCVGIVSGADNRQKMIDEACERENEDTSALQVSRSSLADPANASGTALNEEFLTPGRGTSYHIKPYGGTDRYENFLSCSSDGKVDLFGADDGSGRQQWYLIPVGQEENDHVYQIHIAGGTGAGAKMLSCSSEGTVDLWSRDDGSGRQRWSVRDSGHGWHHIHVNGGTDPGGDFLSCRADGYVDLFHMDDGSGRQRWVLEAINPPALRLTLVPIVLSDGNFSGGGYNRSTNVTVGARRQKESKNSIVDVSTTASARINKLRLSGSAALRTKIVSAATSAASTTISQRTVLETFEIPFGKPFYVYQAKLSTLDDTVEMWGRVLIFLGTPLVQLNYKI